MSEFKVNNSVVEQMYITCEEALENEDTGKENCQCEVNV